MRKQINYGFIGLRLSEKLEADVRAKARALNVPTSILIRAWLHQNINGVKDWVDAAQAEWLQMQSEVMERREDTAREA